MDHTAQRRAEREYMERFHQAQMAKKGESAKGYLLIHEGETRQQRRARERDERKATRIHERQQNMNYEIAQKFSEMSKTQNSGVEV